MGTLGGVMLLAAVAVPRLLLPVERGWMAGARAISRVTTPLLVGIVFFGVMTPIGLVMRAFGRNTMRHPLVNDSYWIERDGSRRSTMTEKF